MVDIQDTSDNLVSAKYAERLKKSLAFSLTFIAALAIFIVLVFFFGTYNSPKQETKEICTTQACIKAAAMIINNMNFSADPCEDFFEFTCGNFVHKTRLEDQQIGLSTFQIIDKQLGQSLSDVLTLPESDQDIRPVKDAKRLMQSCLNEKCNFAEFAQILQTSTIIDRILSFLIAKYFLWFSFDALKSVLTMYLYTFQTSPRFSELSSLTKPISSSISDTKLCAISIDSVNLRIPLVYPFRLNKKKISHIENYGETDLMKFIINEFDGWPLFDQILLSLFKSGISPLFNLYVTTSLSNPDIPDPNLLFNRNPNQGFVPDSFDLSPYSLIQGSAPNSDWRHLLYLVDRKPSSTYHI
ncbi:neprilysin [Brachionus plicatilis]|uniref:Neprilysin n=1 Tax=Brachionus plicatilis TaxID=10195 RepID=A0A3M7QD01_BRAPC|nr:neprilysin [Brachionus plicatilis]